MAGVTTANRVKYVTGADDNFNVAYRIEERDELLGEYGVGIGVASSVNPDEALTMDVWLFDKSDINSVSGVLMHPDVLRDDARRDAFVSGNNVAIALKPGEEFQLRTRTLEVVGKVTAVSFGTAERTGIPIRSMEIEILGRPIHI